MSKKSFWGEKPSPLAAVSCFHLLFIYMFTCYSLYVHFYVWNRIEIFDHLQVLTIWSMCIIAVVLLYLELIVWWAPAVMDSFSTIFITPIEETIGCFSDYIFLSVVEIQWSTQAPVYFRLWFSCNDWIFSWVLFQSWVSL